MSLARTAGFYACEGAYVPDGVAADDWNARSLPSPPSIQRSTTMPETLVPAAAIAGNGHITAAPESAAPRSPLLARLTSLTVVTMVASAAMIFLGVVALVGGNYTNQVVHDQLAPQKIFFPKAGDPALLPGVKQYAGQQLLTGDQAKAYANNFIGEHVKKIAGGQTYAQVSAKSQAAPKNAELTGQKTALFQGETLRGLLLGAWGWSVVGMVATIAGFVLILIGAVLFLLPAANWFVNLRSRPTAATS
jgi:hypothetical protein